ncbi:hypothetical protein [Frankia sp. CiP3]|uniref:hypothetical protein n=1 Tax=Frankia sp. CiP3 TaxID=2880971 RepID=UPI001EF53BA2|nr:hypothetical protein [Frankia sp. CiP3]
MVADCDYALERWADEDAATAVADRGLAAVALTHAALATTDSAAPTVLAFHEHAVTRRVSALLAPPPPPRWLPAALPAALGLIVAACAVEAGREVERLFELAMHVLPH